MNAVTQLGYVGIESYHLDAWERFAVDLLGMQLAYKQPGQRLGLRMDDHAQRIIIEHGPSEDLAYSGFEVATAAGLRALTERIRKHGIAVQAGTPELARQRGVEELFICQDPDGNRVELYCGPILTNAPFTSKTLHSAFVTDQLGMGHYFLTALTEREKMLDFYNGLLGFRISDYIREELAPGIVADAAFLHCNGRHHTIAVAQLPGPKRMHHLMIEVANMSDVGLAFDRCKDAGMAFEMTLGMHPNDKMFSFYVVTPSGFSIEMGWGGLIVNDDTWTVKSYDHLSEWGHRKAA